MESVVREGFTCIIKQSRDEIVSYLSKVMRQTGGLSLLFSDADRGSLAGTLGCWTPSAPNVKPTALTASLSTEVDPAEASSQSLIQPGSPSSASILALRTDGGTEMERQYKNIWRNGESTQGNCMETPVRQQKKLSSIAGTAIYNDVDLSLPPELGLVQCEPLAAPSPARQCGKSRRMSWLSAHREGSSALMGMVSGH